MGISIRWPLTAWVALLTPGLIHAQAGRYVPRFNPGEAGSGGWHIMPHYIPSPSHGGDADSSLWILLIVLLVGAVIYGLGHALANGDRSSVPGNQAPSDFSNRPDFFKPDQVLHRLDVANKVTRTGRLMDFLAYQDHSWNRVALHDWLMQTFCLIQKAWENRDYGPVQARFRPGLLKKHQRLLQTMRREREINRIENLEVQRVEFVHLRCPKDRNSQEVAALISFQASVNFVDDRTGAFTRDRRPPCGYQECWILRRQDNAWRVQTIEIGIGSKINRLRAANEVAGLTPEQLRSAQDSIAL